MGQPKTVSEVPNAPEGVIPAFGAQAPRAYDILVAVTPDRELAGVYKPGHRRSDGATSFDWREPPGTAENQGNVVCNYDLVQLRAALARFWPKDHHLVTYQLLGPEMDGRVQPRVNKNALEWLGKQGYQVVHPVLFIDIDLPKDPATNKKRKWDQELQEEWAENIRTKASLAGLGGYYTPGGLRFFAALKTPLAPAQFERAVQWALRDLIADGLDPDLSCSDWTRHFRLPSVMRKDGRYAEPYAIHFEAWEPERVFDPPPEVLAEPEGSARARAKRPAHVRVLDGVAPDFLGDVPPAWEAGVALLGEAIAEDKPDAFHMLGLRLAGAMCRRRVDLALIPALVAAAIMRGGGVNYADALAPARDTVQRYVAGIDVTGTRQLHAYAPQTGAALDEVLAEGHERVLREEAKALVAERLMTADEATAQMFEAMDAAPEGVSLYSPPPGVGKSATLRKLGAQRAEDAAQIMELDDTDRTPRGYRTAISVPTHELALEYVGRLQLAFRTPARRHFSPPTLKDTAGEPVCQLAEAARALSGGGLSVQEAFCNGRGQQPCDYAEGCAAKPGILGPEAALVDVAPHAYLGRLATAAGTRGVLAIDEPPGLIETATFTREAILEALQFTAMSRRYAQCLRPMADALRSYLGGGEPDVHTRLQEAIDIGRDAVGELALEAAYDAAGIERGDDLATDVVRCAAMAQKEDARTPAPPFRWTEIARAKTQPAHAALLKRVSAFYVALCRLVTAAYEPSLWITVRARKRELVFKFTNETLVDALRRPGSTLVLDANTEVYRAAYCVLLRGTPPEHRYAVTDGAPITRTLLRAARANKSHWYKGEYPVWTGGVRRALQRVVARLVATGATKAGLISFVVVRQAIEAIVNREYGEAAWRRAERDPHELAKARAALGPILAQWPGVWTFGHYGAVRGVNRFEDANLDALATLGDPWPDLGDVVRDGEHLGLGEEPGEQAETIARAQLQQAHGRMREPRRDRPADLMHVGNLLPAGTGWMAGDVQIVRDEGGRRALPPALTGAQLSETLADLTMTPEEAAQRIGCSPSTFYRYLAGQAPFPDAALVRLLQDDKTVKA